VNQLLFAHMKPMKPISFDDYSEEAQRIEHEKQVITYKPAYDWVLDQIHEQVQEFARENYKPEKLVLGAETYLQMVSSLSYHSKGFVKPEEYWGLEIIVKPGHGIDVVGDIGTELSRQYWRKKK
jgi:hypothetical protein